VSVLSLRNMSGESSRQKFKLRVVSAAKKLVSGGHSVQLDTCMPHHRPINATHGAGKKETSRAPACHRKGVSNVHCAEQYRAKAAEFRAFLTNTSRSPNETREFRDLEQTYTTLAENEEWMAVHLNRTALAEEEEQILKCLGAAVLMRWNTVPTKLQRELFDCASSIGDLQQTTPLKGQIARFLHNHKNDQQKSG
jgi:hypothetical protein